MGANAQTTVPTFTLGQVLEASQLNQSARTGVPVFAGTTERDAAFGGTGEKTLAEGQLCYLESTNVVQYYDGSNWATVGPTTAATPGLELVSATTIGSTVATVTVTGAFSSTYDNYLVKLEGGVASTSLNLRLTLGSTTTGYYYAGPFMQYTSATVSGQNSSNVAFTEIGYGTTNALSAEVEIGSPNLAKRTTFRSRAVGTAAATFVNFYGGFLDDATQYTAFTIATSTGTITGGTIRVYGYKN